MNEEKALSHNQERQAPRMRLPGFVSDDDVGLGDVLKRVAYAAGIKPCSGCEQRAATLNRWLTFSGSGR